LKKTPPKWQQQMSETNKANGIVSSDVSVVFGLQ